MENTLNVFFLFELYICVYIHNYSNFLYTHLHTHTHTHTPHTVAALSLTPVLDSLQQKLQENNIPLHSGSPLSSLPFFLFPSLLLFSPFFLPYLFLTSTITTTTITTTITTTTTTTTTTTNNNIVPVFIYATAGLRGLPGSQSENIIFEIRKMMHVCLFFFFIIIIIIIIIMIIFIYYYYYYYSYSVLIVDFFKK